MQGGERVDGCEVGCRSWGPVVGEFEEIDPGGHHRTEEVHDAFELLG